MKNEMITEGNLQHVKEWENSGAIEADLLLFDQMDKLNIPDEPRRMKFIVVGLCTNGSAKYTLDTEEQHVEAGDLIVISDRQVFDNYQPSPDLQGMIIGVSVDFYREIIQNVGELSALFFFARNYRVLHLKDRDQGVFMRYFRAIRERINQPEIYFRKHLVRTLLLAMFYDLSNVIYHFQKQSDRRQSRAEIIFNRFIRDLEENCRRERRVNWYAEKQGITAKYLSESVKRVSQRTPNEWIDNYVTLELRVLLKNTTKNIKEITEEMNFPNQSFLGKFFKEHVGMSPTEYRHS
jgi:AraC-like DNA-binding protein